MAVYDTPLLYDVAFGYRDFRAEVDALAAWYTRVHPGAAAAPRSVLELASGPSDHAIEWSLRGAEVAAVDLSPEMCEYASGKARLAGTRIDVHCADMVDFRLGRRFDLAMLMMNSISHLHTVDRLVEHLRTVASHLEAGGVYVLEVQHPRDFVGRGARPSGVSLPWRVDRYGLEVETRWGSPDDPYDPLAQVFDARVELRVHDGEGEHTLIDRCRMRDWGFPELQAAIGWSGAFEIAELHGGLEADAPLDAESWRMVLVLRRR